MENVFSMALSMIADKYKYEDKKDWIENLVEHSYRFADEHKEALWPDGKVDLEQFMENVFSGALFMIADKYKYEDKKDWVENIVEHSYRFADEHREGLWPDGKAKLEWFMENVFSMALFMIAQKYNYEDKKDWVENLVEHSYRFADEHREGLQLDSKVGLKQFMVNVFSMALSNIADKHKYEDKEDWVVGIFGQTHEFSENMKMSEDFVPFTYVALMYQFNNRFKKRYDNPIEQRNAISRLYSWQKNLLLNHNIFEEAVKTPDLKTVIEFLSNTSAMALCFGEGDVAEKIFDMVSKEKLDLISFMVNVFSMAISMIARKYDYEDKKDWVAWMLEQIQEFSRNKRMPDYFIPLTYVALMYQLNMDFSYYSSLAFEISQKLKYSIYRRMYSWQKNLLMNHGILEEAVKIKSNERYMEIILHFLSITSAMALCFGEESVAERIRGMVLEEMKEDYENEMKGSLSKLKSSGICSKTPS